MRRSLAVIQPSLFEGWSSVVEESRMLGKTIILSDLAVHYEQAPDFAVYFDRNNAKDLAEKILDLLPRLSPGPDHRENKRQRKNLLSSLNNSDGISAALRWKPGGFSGKKSVLRFLHNLCPIKLIPPNFPVLILKYPSSPRPSTRGNSLRQCIDSILSQNYPNLEYVIMDGGSTDNSVNIIKKYEKHLTYWQSRPDDGQYPAINEGFKKTTGEIMTWINSDDILHPGSLETVADIFLIAGVEWIMGGRTALFNWQQNNFGSSIFLSGRGRTI